MQYKINTEVFEKFPAMDTDRLLLREFSINDSEALFKIRSNDNVMRFMGREEMKSISEATEFINKIISSFEDKSGINWAIVEKTSGKFIGYCCFWRIDYENCRGEIGYALHPDYWNLGYMKEAVVKLIEFAFCKLKLHSIEANTDPENISSGKLLESTGFIKEAYFRENFLFRDKFIDSVVYSLLESDLSRKKNI